MNFQAPVIEQASSSLSFKFIFYILAVHLRVGSFLKMSELFEPRHSPG